ncbi:Cytoplasmic tRNA 2-thiolation protein-like protein [Emericellopsis cladophorae]|uniref:Cytoplasmic tRNA 2-thiolation protein 2 n=1 Tax=Emericellopsis cladophorae TaxID=2686198 RepID=A0A9Q0BCA7_9HYPO|nr:Cytoplasmic tRNA 2-thiolation protein-like protein [Emericellopsis cladophorae]KAI6779541.1 Cytoplasmic tRNA 2-thiolation protein-like protein [Emericellopsis cladophorae]
MEGSKSQPCKKCKNEDAPFNFRNAPTCRDCYMLYIEQKTAKGLRALHTDIRTSTLPEPRRYVAGLSFGASSSAMVCALDKHTHREMSKKSTSLFEVLAVHVDTDLSDHHGQTPAMNMLNRYREKFPNVKFQCVHLGEVLSLKTVDWSTLPGLSAQGTQSARLQKMFDTLPSVTAKADILRLLTRHLLIHVAMAQEYGALLLGYTTTALASLTMAEVANGRGFSVPWQVQDSRSQVCTYEDRKAVSKTEFPIYHPMRETFRNEVKIYNSLIPSLAEIVPNTGTSPGVVSHKDTSIDEVMTRYFDGVEESLSGIVANVVRTTGKLAKLRGNAQCGLCGVTTDEQGDSRWAGELGEEESNQQATRLCYGCKRSING